MKATITNADGSTVDLFDQAYTDAAVAAAVAAVPVTEPVNTVTPEVTEVDLVLTDGSTKKFVAAA